MFSNFSPRYLSNVVVIALIGVTGLTYMLVAASYALPFPQYDDFSNLVDWAVLVSQVHRLGDHVALFVLSQQEHQQFFTKIIIALSLALTGHFSLTSLIVIGNLSWCVAVFILMAIGYRIPDMLMIG